MPEPRNAHENERRRQELDAVARGGERGRAEYQQSQALLASQKTASIKAALAEAAQRGAPAGMQAEISGTVGAPYDRQIGNLSQASASRTAELAQLSAGNAVYMGQVAAAGPAMRGALERKVAASRAAKAKELSDAQMETRLLGAARLEREPLEAALAPAEAALAKVKAKRWGSTYDQLKRAHKGAQLTKRVGQLNKALATPVEARARQIGIAAGVDPILVHGRILDKEVDPLAPLLEIVKQSKAEDYLAERGSAVDPISADLAKKAGVTPDRLAKIRAGTSYRLARQSAESARQKGITINGLKRVLNKHPDVVNAAAIRLVLAEYADLLPTAAAPKDPKEKTSR